MRTDTVGQKNAGVVILAAGNGERLGHGPKALIEISRKPLLLHVLDSMAANRNIAEIVVAAPGNLTDDFEKLISATHPAATVRVVAGGDTRQASAHRGVNALSADVQWVAITDVARPFPPVGIVDRLLNKLWAAQSEAMAGHPEPCGIIPALAVSDSVHRADGRQLLAETVDRSLLCAAQTPQVFHRECISDAYALAQSDHVVATDDAGLAIRFGKSVMFEAGDPANFKITFEQDLLTARALHASMDCTAN